MGVHALRRNVCFSCTHGLPIRQGLAGLFERAATLPIGPAFVPPAQEFVDAMLRMSHP